MDSVRQQSEKFYLKHFFDICDLVSIIGDSANKSFRFEGWRLFVDSECYQQNNGYDCGTFVCLYMYSIMNNDYDYTRRLKKNRRDVLRRVIDQCPEPSKRTEVRFTYKGWFQYPQFEYDYVNGSTIISEFQMALKYLNCSICGQKVEREKERCIVCNNEAHKKCLNENNLLCLCQKDRNYSSESNQE